MARVIWRDQATHDLDRIIAFIHQFHPVAALKIGVSLRDLGESLARTPERGRPVDQFRELVAVRPYILRYSVSGNIVIIHSIRHSARSPSSE